MSLTTKKRHLKEKRVMIGAVKKEIMQLPDLIEIQLNSYEWFLQRDKKLGNEEALKQGLQQLFEEVFPIVSADEKMSLELLNTSLQKKILNMIYMMQNKKDRPTQFR